MVSVSIVRSVRRFVSFLHSPFDIPVAISCRGKLPLVELDVVASLVPMTPMISTEGERERAECAVSHALGSQIILHAPRREEIDRKQEDGSHQRPHLVDSFQSQPQHRNRHFALSTRRVKEKDTEKKRQEVINHGTKRANKSTQKGR